MCTAFFSACTRNKRPLFMVIKHLAVLACIVVMQGCTQGLLYSHTTTPLTTNYQLTPNSDADKRGDGSTKHIHVQLQAKWDTNGIGEIAKEHGLHDIYYADLEKVSVLLGIWEQEYVHIYGQ